jgi:hypothetical protein
MEWVQIVHPDLPETQDAPPSVSRESYEEVWSKNGWKLYKPSKASKEK